MTQEKRPRPSEPFPEGSPIQMVREALAEREENYGHPADNFSHIADLWNALFGTRFSAEDVALALLLLKVSRLYRTPGHGDSLVDIVGYAQCAWMIGHPSETRSDT